MLFPTTFLVLAVLGHASATEPCSTGTASTTTRDYAAACYESPLPTLTSSAVNRTIPWGEPSFVLANGTTCCSSLAEIRAGINAIDDQLIALLAQRSGYVREATRFKATLGTIDVPSRNKEVIEGAVADGKMTSPPLPDIIAREAFGSIIEGGVAFEKCVFEKYDGVGA